MQSSDANSGLPLAPRALPGVLFSGEGTSTKSIVVSLLTAIAFVALVAYCSVGAVMMTITSARFIPNQRENGYTESPHVYAAVQAARSGHIYLLLSRPPYVLQSYGPLFYIVNMGIARASHLDVDLTRIHIRLFVFACFLLCAASVFFISRRLHYSVNSAGLAALMLLAQPLFFDWNNAVRPDVPFLLAMLASLYFALDADRGREWSYVLSGVFAGTAFLMKQPGMAVAIAIFGVLAFNRRFRHAAYFALGVGAPIILVLGILLARHEPFLAQFTTVGKSVWSLASGIQFTEHELNKTSVLVPLAVGAIGILGALGENVGTQMLAAFAAVNWCVGLAGIPQLGGDVNYFLPGIAGCTLLLPLAVRVVGRNMRSIVGLILIIFVLGQATYGVVKASNAFSHIQLNVEANPYEGLRPFRVLSDRPIYTLHGSEPDLLDPFSNHALELAGHWDSAPIAESVRSGKYDLIILDCTGYTLTVCNFRGVAFFSPAVVRAINEDYEVLCSTMMARVLKPRSRDVAATPEMLAPALGAPCGTKMHGHAPALYFMDGTR